MHTERFFIVGRIRTCSVCKHDEDPRMPVVCADLECHCHENVCTYDSPPDTRAHARVLEVIRYHGRSTVEVVANGILITPFKPKAMKKPKPDPKAPRIKKAPIPPPPVSLFDEIMGSRAATPRIVKAVPVDAMAKPKEKKKWDLY
jgi:hypothetical protein